MEKRQLLNITTSVNDQNENENRENIKIRKANQYLLNK